MKMTDEKIKIGWKMGLSLLFILIGIILYLAWGITYGVWADVGIYSITIFFLAIGIIGFLLARMEQ